MSLRDDIVAVAEAICDAEGFAVNPANVADSIGVAKAAMRKMIERLLPLPAIAASPLLTNQLGNLSIEIAAFEPEPVEVLVK